MCVGTSRTFCGCRIIELRFGQNSGWLHEKSASFLSVLDHFSRKVWSGHRIHCVHATAAARPLARGPEDAAQRRADERSVDGDGGGSEGPQPDQVFGELR